MEKITAPVVVDCANQNHGKVSMALRIILALVVAPVIPWVAYGSLFAGMNAANLLAGAAIDYPISAQTMLDITSVFAIAAPLVILNYFRNPKAFRGISST